MASVLVTEHIHEAGLRILRAKPGLEVIEGWTLDAGRRAAAATGAAAILVRTARIDAAMIGAARNLKIISKHGVGTDNIDRAAAAAAGVAVTITAGANDGSVAEHTMALLLAAAKNLRESDRIARQDYASRGRLSSDLAGKRALILGFGRIGQRLLPLLQAFGVDVVVFGPRVTAVPEGARIAPSLEAGLEGADILTVHVPLTPETRGLIDAGALARLAPGAIIVNTARGGIVDEGALAEAVRRGHVGGVGFDVFSDEPIRPDNPLLGLERAILTPHVAAMSEAGMRLMAEQSAQNVIDGLAGRPDPGMLLDL